MATSQTTEEKETEATKHAENMQAVDEAKQDAMKEAARAEGEEAMRIAKINHPEVDWQADPETGAPLVGGTGSGFTSPEPQEPDEEDSPAAIEKRVQSGAGYKTRAEGEAAEAKSKKAMAAAEKDAEPVPVPVPAKKGNGG